MLCWKAFGSPGVIGQAWDGNIPTRRVRVAVAPRRTSGTRPGAAMPGRRGRVALRITRECPADAGWRGHHPGMPGMVDGERLGRVADPPEVPSRRTGLPPCPDRGHGARRWFGCLVGELRWVGASIGMSTAREPGRGQHCSSSSASCGRSVRPVDYPREVERLAAHAQTNKWGGCRSNQHPL